MSNDLYVSPELQDYLDKQYNSALHKQTRKLLGIDARELRAQRERRPIGFAQVDVYRNHIIDDIFVNQIEVLNGSELPLLSIKL